MVWKFLQWDEITDKIYHKTFAKYIGDTYKFHAWDIHTIGTGDPSGDRHFKFKLTITYE
jgi:hypothetical protein